MDYTQQLNDMHKRMERWTKKDKSDAEVEKHQLELALGLTHNASAKVQPLINLHNKLMTILASKGFTPVQIDKPEQTISKVKKQMFLALIECIQNSKFIQDPLVTSSTTNTQC